MIKKLLSVPPNLAKVFHEIEEKDNSWFCSSDPIGKKVGSGGGTAWLLKECYKNEDQALGFNEWLLRDKRIIVHAGGQSRRLPAYASVGKILAPIPVFRWKRGQKIGQNLLDVQLPLYEKLLEKSPGNLNTLIASGDVYIHANQLPEFLPQADVVCLGMWAEPALATNHGVFVCDKSKKAELCYMLQKPEVATLQKLLGQYHYLMDIGIWLLSPKALKLLFKYSGYNLTQNDVHTPANPKAYDLYSEFGLALGTMPSLNNHELQGLKVAILPLHNCNFYHFGTSRELISSSLALQNKVVDPRAILHKDRKPHPSMFVQNAVVQIKLEENQRNLWIENAYINKGWDLNSEHIITGIPENNWAIKLPDGICIDMITVNDDDYCIRVYGYSDAFRGAINSSETLWMGQPAINWFKLRGVSFEKAFENPSIDIQAAPVFPVVNKNNLRGTFIQWLINGECDEEDKDWASFWLKSTRISADEIMVSASLKSLYKQRNRFLAANAGKLYENYQNSVFFQVDLDDLAARIVKDKIDLPPVIFDGADRLVHIHHHMFKARIKQYRGEKFDADEQNAFTILKDSILGSVDGSKLLPQLSVFKDQIIWGRSPARIDLAGGWSDTPPACIFNGGAVVNMAIELNGQPPLHVYIKPIEEFKIILRSIDIGSREDITTYTDLQHYNRVGSAFSIPKAALMLSGFHPQFSEINYETLSRQLQAFGSGIEISTLAAIPKGSGLGTSSILAATVLGTLSDFCGFGWSSSEISSRTLMLEQLLTTGGGWQDQYGGVLGGIKLLETDMGFDQGPVIRWAPEYLFTNPEHKTCMLLYYTGITRTAKNILSEIVKGMFLNSSKITSMLADIQSHAYITFEALQKNDFAMLNRCIATTWKQKQAIDKGTMPKEIEQIITLVQDLLQSCTLPGAGGGGYLFMVAKDPDAAAKIKNCLNNNPPNDKARFVDFAISGSGFQVSRS